MLCKVIEVLFFLFFFGIYVAILYINLCTYHCVCVCVYPFRCAPINFSSFYFANIFRIFFKHFSLALFEFRFLYCKALPLFCVLYCALSYAINDEVVMTLEKKSRLEIGFFYVDDRIVFNLFTLFCIGTT